MTECKHTQGRWAAGRWRPAVLLLMACMAGCGRSASTPPQPVETLTALEVLRRMQQAYRDAQSYADNGRLIHRFRQGTEQVDDQVDFSVAFVRPNKLRLHVYQATVVCDGRQLWAAIGDLPDQVLRAKAPKSIELADLYERPVLGDVLRGGIVGPALQLGLLLDDDVLEQILEGADAPQFLPPESVAGANCYRVLLKRPDGDLTFWIDQRTFAVRRVSFPTGEYRKALEEGGRPQVEDLQLAIEFEGARFNVALDEAAFAYRPPKSARVVAEFDLAGLVPPPPPPSKLLGQQVPDFTFVGLDGKDYTRANCAGRILVLDFWATDCVPCRDVMALLERVRAAYSPEQVQFLSVSIDPASVPDSQLEQYCREAGAKLLIARDPQLAARDVFGVEAIPALFVIDAQGVVQVSEVGLNPALDKVLSRRLERLLAGESVHQEVLAEYRHRQAEYEQAVARSRQAAAAGEIPLGEIKPASEPETLRAHRLWSTLDVPRPGNFLIFAEGERQRVFVASGWDAVAELGPQGEVLARHELVLPPGPDESIVSYFRFATDASGRRWYAACAPSQQRLHLFDETWQHVLTFPAEGTHDGISDVQLADLDADGQPELLVGYYGVVGVQCVDLSGRRRWSVRTLENVFNLAVLPPDDQGRRTVLCANGLGTPIPIDADGRTGHAVEVPGRFFRLVASRDLDGDGQPELCGLAVTRAGDDTAVGFTARGEELWSYTLPLGVHRNAALEPVTAGNLLGDKAAQWVLAGADGTIHLLSHLGELIDHFGLGAPPAGMGVATLDGKQVLLIAVEDRVEAWEFSR